MKRRPLLGWAVAALALAGCTHTPGATAQPRYTVSAAQLDQVLAERFPRRLAAAGVIELQIRAPRLRRCVGRECGQEYGGKSKTQTPANASKGKHEHNVMRI